LGGVDEVGSAAAASSSSEVWQPESMWLLMADARTPRLQIGHTTMATKESKC
jgi:hypothetical protein